MNNIELNKVKNIYWGLWAFSLVLSLSLMIYLLTFRWSIYTLLALMSLMFASFSLCRGVEYRTLRKVYRNNSTEFTVPRLFQKNSRAINPNNNKGKLFWLFSVVLFIFFSIFIAILDVILLFI